MMQQRSMMLMVCWVAACAGVQMACAQAVPADAPYVCWQKASPWDALDRQQSPPAGVAPLESIAVDMGRNEYESASFVLTNPSNEAMTFAIACASDRIDITLRKGAWVTLDDGTQINDALCLIDDGRVTIPAGESLEIWLTLYGNDAQPGVHRSTITIVPDGGAAHTVHVDANVRDVTIPQDLPLDVFHWDEVVAYWQSSQVTRAFMEDMKAHYVNYAYVHCHPLPRLKVDAAGELAMDFTDFDSAMEGYEPLEAKGYIFFWAANSMLEPAGDAPDARPEFAGRPEFMTPRWKELFNQWLTEWVANLKSRGIGYDRFVMHPYDERSGPTVRAIVEQIRRVDPNIRIAFNGSLESAEHAASYAPYVDVWIPFMNHFLDEGGIHGYFSRFVPVEPNTTYTYSFFSKNGSTSIYYDLMFDGSTQRIASAVDATRWRKEQLTFTTAADTTQVELRFFPMVGNKTIFIDDVELRSPSGDNIVVDGDMEADDALSTWRVISAEMSISATDAHTGDRSAMVRNIPSGDTSVKDAMKRALSQDKGKLWWTYANPPVAAPGRASPYHYYRLAVWRTWREGMTGFSMWTYKGGRWDSTGQGPNWGMVYRTDEADCPASVSRRELVVPGKRWEACREGVEDYVYLHMLRSAINDTALSDDAPVVVEAARVLDVWTDRVIDASDNEQSQLADQAKAEILDAIVSLAGAR